MQGERAELAALDAFPAADAQFALNDRPEGRTGNSGEAPELCYSPQEHTGAGAAVTDVVEPFPEVVDRMHQTRICRLAQDRQSLLCG
jgi:hypothetical protein